MQNQVAVPDYLHQYLGRAYGAPMLSRERELDLARRMKQGGRDAQRARDELVTAHLKLAAKLAKKFSRRGRPLDELVQEANLGLMLAVDKFDPDRGWRFATYAMHWILQQLRLYCNDAPGVVRVPISRLRLIGKLQKAVKKLEAENKQPTDEALASELEWTVERVREIFESMVSEFSLNAPARGYEDKEVGDLVADQTSDSPEDLLVRLQEEQQLDQLLGTLSPREREVVSHRFGLSKDKKKTLRELGDEMRVSAERVRQIEVGAVRKLRRRAG